MNKRLQVNSLIQYRTLLTHATSILAPKTPVNLSFKVVGSSTDPAAPAIFLLHGLLGNKLLWRGIAKTIAHITKQMVIVVDLRNHGTSPHISSNKYDEMGLDLIQLFNKLKVDKASILGYDIGGRMAMCASLIAPSKVSRLIVADISPVSTSDHMKSMIKIMKAMKAVDFKNPKKVSKARKDARKQLKEVVKEEAIMFRIMANIKLKSNGVIGWNSNLDALIKYFDHFLTFPKSLKGKKFKGPCLFLGGQLSEYIPADDLTKIREIFPQAVVRYIVKTGHNLHLEDPRSFLEHTIAFIKFDNLND